MSDLDVRIVKLDPLRVASVRVVSESTRGGCLG
jgi:hypothetical protein